MEEKINITEILKEKPQGTKLHDLLPKEGGEQWVLLYLMLC